MLIMTDHYFSTEAFMLIFRGFLSSRNLEYDDVTLIVTLYSVLFTIKFDFFLIVINKNN